MDAPTHSRLNQGSCYNLGTTATNAEARKIGKNCKLPDTGYTFLPVAIEVQGPLSESNEYLITRPCSML